jgi:hypothetical protein
MAALNEKLRGSGSANDSRAASALVAYAVVAAGKASCRGEA